MHGFGLVLVGVTVQGGALALLDAGFVCWFLIVHCVEAGVAGVEDFIVVFGLELGLGVIATEPGDSVGLVGIQCVLVALLSPPPLLLPLQTVFVLHLLLNELTIHALLRSTLEHFLEILKVLNIALDA